MLRVAAFTQGVNVPSARFRIRQYISELRKLEIEMKEFASEEGAYPPISKLDRPFWAVKTLCKTAVTISKARNFDLSVLQREMFSTFFTLERWTKKPRILDVDDAIWLHRGGGFAQKLAESCDAVICGQEFLAERFSKWNPNIHLLPTAVDTERFFPLKQVQSVRRIGWTGGSSAFAELYRLEKAFKSCLDENPDARIRILSDARPSFSLLPESKVEFIRWSPDVEVEAIQGMTVGIMPLEDTLWNRGKCSYKMLLYMACGIPVVVSPVGMNLNILQNGEIGYAAQQDSQWIDALHSLLNDETSAERIGANGRKIAERDFGLIGVAQKFSEILSSTAP